MYSYSISEDGTIVRSDGSFIPKDPLNYDYCAYLKWIEDGNVATLPSNG